MTPRCHFSDPHVGVFACRSDYKPKKVKTEHDKKSKKRKHEYEEEDEDEEEEVFLLFFGGCFHFQHA